ncbi:hypothetical protein DEU56DRAFT_535937 [Suillus clintonianus]|uniref:uncharacterized protein n=1 Tax=Suillus clintonianus TaxID=1904413 RepID=UPI001B885530|nr:uncharacterized protein DEU56DRAFT_535937 [Suillus clintonianus]KAG2126951.1 hypothetical protein DEU56DRAFT_535937 [Suillus clintonianus]
MSSKKSKAGKSIKSEKDSKQFTPETEELLDDNVSQLLGVTIAAISVTRDLVPITLAKSILGTVANILIIAQSVIKNKSDFLAIVKKCETIRKQLEIATKDATEGDLQGSLGEALSELNISVKRINTEVVSKKEQGFLKSIFSVTINRDQIAGWEKDLDRVLALFNFKLTAGIAIDVKKLLKGNTASIKAPKYRPTEPPSRPDMFYGRDKLVAELTNLVVNDKHIALIGPGGMGKSSLAKAILNEPLVMEKFTDRRFFVTYDGLDPSAITFETFMTRFVGALGIEIAGADPVRQISSFLRSASALIVLDNAETFEEASASSRLGEIPPAIAEIANISGVIIVLTSRSRRNAPNVRWITKDIPPLDLSSAQAVFFQIYYHTSRSDAEENIKGLLKELDFHPLSINLLANAAQQNSWSPAALLKRWKDRHSKVLDAGKEKLHSLSDTMELSLSSPSVLDLGVDGRRALAIIAFLPQGLNEDLASDLLPSLPQVDAICDVLCMQSLVYRQDKFIKMLAPIRHYVQDSLSHIPDSTCLQDICAFYYRSVKSCLGDRDQYADIIISDHLNIEHVVAFKLAHVPDGTEETYKACWQFLQCLKQHLPRPTTLSLAISNIVENSSTWALKAYCLSDLGGLYRTLSQIAEAVQAFRAAEALYLTAGDLEDMAYCLSSRADMLRCQGRFIESQNLLEDLQHSDSWESLSKSMKARAWKNLDTARMHTFTVSADELFVKSSEDHVWDLRFKIWHWRAKLYYGADTVQVHTHLDDLFLQCTSTRDVFGCRDALEGLAQIAFIEDNLSDAMHIRKTTGPFFPLMLLFMLNME